MMPLALAGLLAAASSAPAARAAAPAPPSPERRLSQADHDIERLAQEMRSQAETLADLAGRLGAFPPAYAGDRPAPEPLDPLLAELKQRRADAAANVSRYWHLREAANIAQGIAVAARTARHVATASGELEKFYDLGDVASLLATASRWADAARDSEEKARQAAAERRGSARRALILWGWLGGLAAAAAIVAVWSLLPPLRTARAPGAVPPPALH